MIPLLEVTVIGSSSIMLGMMSELENFRFFIAKIKAERIGKRRKENRFTEVES